MKTMKIKLLALVAALLLPLAMNAATAAESNFLSNVMQFLKEEGFSPKIDEESEGLDFKKEGVLYWLNFTSDGNQMFVEFHRAGLSLEDSDMSKVMDAVNKANVDVRSAKAMIVDGSVSFAVEMYCHSAEEFRYVFYSCLGSLDRLRDSVYENYNNGGSSSISGSISNGGSSSYSGSSSYNQNMSGEDARNMFFPIYGLTIGQSRAADFRNAGYEVKASASGTTSCYLPQKGMFFDYNEDGYFEKVCVLSMGHEMPSRWASLGFSWGMSYNQVISKLTNMGFEIDFLSEPEVKKYDGRNVLDAMVRATTKDGRFVFVITFGSGNRNGEGYSRDSRNSIDNFQMEWM